MKHAPSSTLVFIAAGLALAAGSAWAATAVGPYYANPAWDQTLPAETRFIVLSNMNGEAVLDRETGLVWEKSPRTSPLINWASAQAECNSLSKGNRKGWRLPTIQELTSLVDTLVAPPGPVLSPGHPFPTVQQSGYWSATSSAGDNNSAWLLNFNTGNALVFSKSSQLFFWCVRGGRGVDAQ